MVRNEYHQNVHSLLNNVDLCKYNLQLINDNFLISNFCNSLSAWFEFKFL